MKKTPIPKGCHPKFGRTWTRLALNLLGPSEVSKALGRAVSRQAVQKWTRQGHLPMTELTGGTKYAAIIARMATARSSLRFTANVLRAEIPKT